MKILGVTACPTGIAHTYMAAEAIAQAAEAKGYEVKVETRGSVGVENELTAEDIKSADVIILAVDLAVDMERFAGKKLIKVGVAEALKDTDKLIEKALNAEVYGAKDLVDQVKEAKVSAPEKNRCLQTSDERCILYDSICCCRWYYDCPCILIGFW